MEPMVIDGRASEMDAVDCEKRQVSCAFDRQEMASEMLVIMEIITLTRLSHVPIQSFPR